MADDGLVIGKPDTLRGMILARRTLAGRTTLVGRGRGRQRFFIDDESALKIDPDRARREDGAIDGGFPARLYHVRTSRLDRNIGR